MCYSYNIIMKLSGRFVRRKICFCISIFAAILVAIHISRVLQHDSRKLKNVHKGPMDLSRHKIPLYDLTRSSRNRPLLHNFIQRRSVHRGIQNHTQDFAKKMNQDRERLASIFRDYDFSVFNGSNLTLDNFIMEKGGQPVRNVIFSTWRSGSTFAGFMLDSHPGSFYLFEPLSHLSREPLRTEAEVKESYKTLKAVLTCNYSAIPKVHELFNRKSFKMHELFGRVLRRYSKRFLHLYENPEDLSKLCKIYPIQSAKVVYGRLRAGAMLLKDGMLTNLHIILLVRDPRGIMASRSVKPWNTLPDANNVRRICKDMEDDYEQAQRLQILYPGRFKVLRYEDMALDPMAIGQNIFDFVHLQFHSNVVKFLKSHTHHNEEDSIRSAHSFVTRNSKANAFKWRKLTAFQANFSSIEYIQRSCSQVMDAYGYVPVWESARLAKFYPLKEPQHPEMFIGFGT